MNGDLYNFSSHGLGAQVRGLGIDNFEEKEHRAPRDQTREGGTKLGMEPQGRRLRIGKENIYDVTLELRDLSLGSGLNIWFGLGDRI